MTLPGLALRYVAYAIMIVVVALGLIGLLERDAGRDASVAGLGTARVEFPSVTRQGLKPALVVEVTNDTARPYEPKLTLETRYLQAIQLGAVFPAPAEVTGVDRGLAEYSFEPLAPGDRLRAVLAFSIDQQAPGLRFTTPVTVGLGERTLLEDTITTLVLP